MTKPTPIYKTSEIGARSVAFRPVTAAITKSPKKISLSETYSSEVSGEAAWFDYRKRQLQAGGKKFDAVQLLEIRLMKELYDGRKHS